VAIDGGGAGVEPDGWWVIEPGDDFVEDFCGLDAGVEDGAAIGGMVAAVDAAAGEVDADVAIFEFGDPGAGGDAVPGDDAPGGWMGASAEDGDGVVVRVKWRARIWPTCPVPPGMTIRMSGFISCWWLAR
jgi:hypothetical protein